MDGQTILKFGGGTDHISQIISLQGQKVKVNKEQ